MMQILMSQQHFLNNFPDDFPRLDAFLTTRAKISRTRAHKLIRSHVVLVNSVIATKISMKLRNKDIVNILGLDEKETLQAGMLIIFSLLALIYFVPGIS